MGVIVRCLRRKAVVWSVTAVLIALCAAVPEGAADTGPCPEFPVAGMVTMVDFGADSCVPCRMMEPVLNKLRKEYEGRAAIVFVNVMEHKQRALDQGIRAIPVQFFYDREGKMVHRHEGFLSEKKIRTQLEKMGVR